MPLWHLAPLSLLSLLCILPLLVLLALLIFLTLLALLVWLAWLFLLPPWRVRRRWGRVRRQRSLVGAMEAVHIQGLDTPLCRQFPHDAQCLFGGFLFGLLLRGSLSVTAHTPSNDLDHKLPFLRGRLRHNSIYWQR